RDRPPPAARAGAVPARHGDRSLAAVHRPGDHPRAAVPPARQGAAVRQRGADRVVDREIALRARDRRGDRRRARVAEGDRGRAGRGADPRARHRRAARGRRRARQGRAPVAGRPGDPRVEPRRGRAAPAGLRRGGRRAVTAPLIAIVGRPNVGKSTLFNRLVGGRPALVHGTPGLTRDRRYGECDYFGAELRVVDTGGLDPEAARDVIGAGIHRQALRAIGEADAPVLVVDGRARLSAIDRDLANQLRATGKLVFLAVNKIDHPTRDDLVHDFHALGLGQPWPV